MWVRGLKQILALLYINILRSHPMWVRGLKRCEACGKAFANLSRTLCGCVD